MKKNTRKARIFSLSRRTIVIAALVLANITIAVLGTNAYLAAVASPVLCGNLQLNRGETCDDGNTRSGDGCSNFCKREICGDGILQKMEKCDDGNRNNIDSCPNDCVFKHCGDGKLGKGEGCDDGNEVNGDGCSARCFRETRCIPGMPGCVPSGPMVTQ